jgi:hypothetical protein
MSDKLNEATLAKAIKSLQNPNSFSAIYKSLTQPRQLTQPQGAVDLGTVSEIRQLASEEEQPPALDIPSLSGAPGGGAPAPAPPPPPPPPPPAPMAAARRPQPSLDEQARLLQEQLGGQYAAYDAAGPAVDPNQDRYAQMPMGASERWGY